jgi:hypothetical protein
VLHGSLKFDFWDTDKAAHYILNLLNDPILSKQVAHDAAQSLDHVSWDLSAHKIVHAYKSKQYF